MPKKNGNMDAPVTDTSRTGRAGRRVGEWVLESLRGAGGFGEVWLARHHVWADQRAAVKLPTHPAYVRSLQREGGFAHRLEHPGIVRPLGMDPFAETPYLVMEYVPGLDLRRYLQLVKKMSPEATTQVLRQVLEALAYAHAAGVIHQDVKPENILLHERALAGDPGFALEGTVKITDFGLGKAEAAAEDAQRGQKSIVFSTDASSPGAQQLAGSLDYMAPEQRGGGEIDARADLYACGVLLYEMLTGERPAGTEVPGDLTPGTPEHLDEAFRRSYARLDRRFGSAREFIDALRPAPVVATPQQEQIPPGLRLSGTVAAPGSCPSCRGRVEKGDQFCMHCGHQLVGVVRRCGRCAAFPAADDNYCMFCGNDLRPRSQSAADLTA